MENKECQAPLSEINYIKEHMINCYGTAYVFEKKSRRYNRLIIFKRLIEIAVPISIFGLFSYIDFPILKYISTFLGVIQAMTLGIFLSLKIEENYSNYIIIHRENYNLADKWYSWFSRLRDSKNFNDLETELNSFKNEMEIRESQRNLFDYNFSMNENDKQQARRAAYIKYGFKCPNCDIVPANKSKINTCWNCGSERR